MSDNQPPQGPPPQGPPPGWQPPQGPPPGWQPPQGPPPGWQPGQGQSPYGPPAGPPNGPGQPPYGGPSNFSGSGPGGPAGGGNGKKVALLIGGGVLAVLVLIAAVIVGVTQLGGDDDKASDDPTTSGGPGGGDKKDKKAGGVMSSSGSDELRKQLTSKGWTCYDSLSEPRIVKRCFLNKPDGDSHTEGVVSLEYDAKDTVGVVQARVESPSTAQSEILDEVAGLIGDSLLDESGSELQEAAKSTSSEGTEIKGARVSTSDGSIYLTRDGYEFQDPEEAPFPAVSETQAGLTDKGLGCKTEGSTLQCEGERSGLRIRAYSALSNGKSSSGWTLTVSPDYNQSGGDITAAAKVAADILVAAKLTTDEGGAFINANPTDGQSGDFGGFNVKMIVSSSGDAFSMIVSVREIR